MGSSNSDVRIRKIDGNWPLRLCTLRLAYITPFCLSRPRCIIWNSVVNSYVNLTLEIVWPSIPYRVGGGEGGSDGTAIIT